MKATQHSAVVTKRDLLMVDPRGLKLIPGHNIRDWSAPEAHEAWLILKEQIREKGGVTKPLKVRLANDGELFEVLDGEGRVTAVWSLLDEGIEIASIPATLEPRHTNDVERIFDMYTDNGGHPLSALDKARGVARLMAGGIGDAEIRKRLGYKTQASIANFERLLSASHEVQQAVRQGEISASSVVELVREHGPEEATNIVREAREKAAARGKTRATPRDIRSVSPPAARPAKRRIEVPAVIDALIALSEGEMTPQQHAESWVSTLDADKVLTAADWLSSFYQALDDRQKAAEDNSRERTQAMFSDDAA